MFTKRKNGKREMMMQEGLFMNFIRNAVAWMIIIVIALLPLKFGTLAGLPDRYSYYPADFLSWMITPWPPVSFPMVSGGIAAAGAGGFPGTGSRFASRFFCDGIMVAGGVRFHSRRGQCQYHGLCDSLRDAYIRVRCFRRGNLVDAVQSAGIEADGTLEYFHRGRTDCCPRH